MSLSQLEAIGMPEKQGSQFLKLRQEYLSKDPINWDDVEAVTEDFLKSFDDLPVMEDKKKIRELLQKLVVVELNGGLGLRMGCKGPKSSLQILKSHHESEGLTFLDCKVMHIEELNKEYDVDIPLVLLNSFNTDKMTKEMLKKYTGRQVNIHTVMQSQYPVMFKDTLAPVPTSITQGEYWYPPGSGDVFQSVHRAGLLDKFMEDGKEFIFIANVENLGATVDERILNLFNEDKLDFLLEVTNRISTDTGGGLSIKYRVDERTHILETSQVPHDLLRSKFHISEYKYWNTNNIWARIKPIHNLLKLNRLHLDFIVNYRNVNGRGGVQLETPAGMAIHNFKKSGGILVPRTRFRPVKTTSELLQAQSELYELYRGMLVMNPGREPATVPLVKLGEEFRTLEEYEKRFASIPHILELDHLTVSGDVKFGKDVTLKGTVIIVADTGSTICIPDGTILENKIVAGDLLVHDY